MPELPEVEIATRRLSRALAGAEVESALAPGMVALRTIEPPLDALAGQSVRVVRRVGKMPVVDFGDLVLLVHLMSAGRLQLFPERASLRDKRSRLLIRLTDGRELRLREFGTQQRAWAKLLPADELEADEAAELRGAIVSTLDGALEHYERVVELPIPDKLPMPLQVHRHQGEPCPRCGTTIEAVFYEDYVMCYCPAEQTGGKVLKDRRLSRLLK